MSRAWIWDMNMNILGTNVPWTSNPPEPVDGSYNDLWHQNLAHNILVNLFHGADFNWYYTSTVSTVATAFADRFLTIPVSDRDKLRLWNLTSSDVAFAVRQLTHIAAYNEASRITIQELYLNGTDRSQYDGIIDQFEILQLGIKWLCIPFVALRQDIRDGSISEGDRPDSTMLSIHLNGDNTRNGLASLDYKGFLTMSTANSKNAEARSYAFSSKFFDQKSISQRTNRTFISYMDSDGISMKLEEPKIIIEPLGGGNGYKCKTNPTRCEPGVPADFCTGNGTSCQP
jgi:hypothetical protein